MTNENKILLHACCAPCFTFPAEKMRLIEEHSTGFTGFFYNPNIQPHEEYKRRKQEFTDFCQLIGREFLIEEDNSQVWLNAVSRVEGFEQEKEKGARCEACFRMRLEKTAKYAKNKGFKGFCTVLTLSPHKDSTVINKIGKETAEKYGIYFLEENFKKENGFLKALEISQKHNLYRQSYCGCVFSQK